MYAIFLSSRWCSFVAFLSFHWNNFIVWFWPPFIISIHQIWMIILISLSPMWHFLSTVSKFLGGRCLRDLLSSIIICELIILRLVPSKFVACLLLTVSIRISFLGYIWVSIEEWWLRSTLRVASALNDNVLRSIFNSSSEVQVLISHFS